VTGPPAALRTDFDLADPAFRADPNAVYRALHERGPVSRASGRNAWVVTGYEEVRSLLRDPRTSAEVPPRPPVPVVGGQHRLVEAREEAHHLFGNFLLHRAPSDHQRLRRLVRPAFSAVQVPAYRGRLQQRTDDCLDGALARGRLDAVGELARPVALTIAADLMGIPEAMRPALGDLARDLVLYEDIPRMPFPRERGLMAMAALAPRIRELIAAWRARPPAQDNVLWALEQARGRGEVSEEEVVAHGAMMLFVSHLTSQHLTSNGVLALLRHPDQWELLRTQPELLETAVEELIRYDSPARVVPRTMVADVEIGGETLRRGDALLVLLGAANRDPAVFADPDRLDITRSPNPHLGFGHDAHYCLGAALATLEAQVVIGTLVRRCPPPRLETEALEWEETLALRGLTSLPILLT
jgi:pimeloyl-[acyl-carrier protein] synthase